jgi:hypothetical protein
MALGDNPAMALYLIFVLFEWMLPRIPAIYTAEVVKTTYVLKFIH